MGLKNSVIYLVATYLVLSVVSAPAATTHPAHDPKIWEKDIQKFEAADQKKMPIPGGVEFIGSSTIRIWNLKKAFPNQNTFNRGFGGSWSIDSAYYADRIVIPYKPRTIIFYAGDNDIAGGATADDVAHSFKDFVTKVHAALPKTDIVFLGIKPSISRWKLWPEMRRANAMVREFAAQMPGVVFVDTSPEMLGDDGKPRRELFQKDGLHMNAKGYVIWNQKVRPYVESP